MKLKSDHECRRAYIDTSLNITFKVCSAAAAFIFFAYFKVDSTSSQKEMLMTLVDFRNLSKSRFDEANRTLALRINFKTTNVQKRKISTKNLTYLFQWKKTKAEVEIVFVVRVGRGVLFSVAMVPPFLGTCRGHQIGLCFVSTQPGSTPSRIILKQI